MKEDFDSFQQRHIEIRLVAELAMCLTLASISEFYFLSLGVLSRQDRCMSQQCPPEILQVGAGMLQFYVLVCYSPYSQPMMLYNHTNSVCIEERLWGEDIFRNSKKSSISSGHTLIDIFPLDLRLRWSVSKTTRMKIAHPVVITVVTSTFILRNGPSIHVSNIICICIFDSNKRTRTHTHRDTFESCHNCAKLKVSV